MKNNWTREVGRTFWKKRGVASKIWKNFSLGRWKVKESLFFTKFKKKESHCVNSVTRVKMDEGIKLKVK
jgi:hypothetical protein